MKIGIVVPSVPGHLNPSCCLGKALQDAGHEVSIITMRRAEPIVRLRGLGFEPASPGGTQEDKKIEELLQQLSTLRGKEALEYTGMILNVTAKMYLKNLPGILSKHGFDALLIDETKQESMSVAELHKVPYGVICNALPTLKDPLVPHFVTTWQPFRPSFLSRWRNLASWYYYGNALTNFQSNDEFRATNGLPKISYNRDTHCGVLSLSQCPAYLDFPRQDLPPQFHHTVPWHAMSRQDVPFDWERLDKDLPLVYASLGTIQNGLIHIFVNLSQACARLDTKVQLVISLGRKDATLGDDDVISPDNTLVVDYCPQLEMLKRAAVLVTHAGQNTALEGLAVGGLPMLAIPITNDQPGVAARWAHAGVARIVKPTETSIDNLKKELNEILSNPSYRIKAQAYQKRLETPSLEQVAELIEIAFDRKNQTPDGKFLRTHPQAVRILGEPESTACTADPYSHRRRRSSSSWVSPLFLVLAAAVATAGGAVHYRSAKKNA